MRIVVCDARPVLHLREAGVLDVLQHTGEILFPSAVDDGLAHSIDGGAAVRPAWLVRRALIQGTSPSPIHHFVTGLGAGD